MAEKISEKSIEEYLRDQVRKIGGKAYKFVSPGNAGVPDRLVVLPGGDLVMSGFLEPDVGPIVARAAELGLRHVATQSREGWMLVHVRRE